MPVSRLDAAAMHEYTGQRCYVLDTGDVQGKQACIRLLRVLKFDAVLVKLDAE